MKKSIIVGNWKAHKTIEEAKEWLEEVQSSKLKVQNSVEVILCAPFVNLPVLKEQLLNPKPYTPASPAGGLNPKLGAQDISRFEDGPYTGEVTGRMLQDLVDYVLIGHSERRKYFGENDEVLKMKVKMALEAKLKPIYCISEAGMLIPEGVEIVAYEPLFAIGSGKPDTPENADLVAGKIKDRRQVKVLYGGSVKPENTPSFIQKPNIDGLLIGGASLSASDFSEIIKNVI